MLDTFEALDPDELVWRFDDFLGEDVQDNVVLFSTKGRLAVTDNVLSRESEVGGRTAVTVVRVLHVPWDAPAVPVGTVFRCTSVDESSDPSMLGARLRVTGPGPGSQTTARRLTVEEVVS